MPKFLIAFTLIFVCKLAVAQNGSAIQQNARPNILLILTDDLGYGDLGVFYQNLRKDRADHAEPWMQTPNLDALAKSGAMLTNNYSAAPVCAPSRASMMSGLSQGHANVRDNQFDKAIEDNYNIASVLKSAGYATAIVGKWGLQGLTSDWPAHPLNRGFDYFYGYMRHSDGHEHYPKEGLYRKPKQVWENKVEVSKDLDKCYTGDLFTAVAKKWIIAHQNTHQNQPFFMFLAFDNPHAVLELPTQQYPAGGGINGGLQWLGKSGQMINTASGKIDSYVHPDYANALYDDDKNPSTPDVPWPDTFKRYATIVRRIDDQVGDLMQLLKDLKIDKNTMVVFTSDNGPSIESYLPKEFVANRPDFFNSFGPFDGIKRDVWEGGMRMPTIFSWPNQIPKNQVIKSPNATYDFLPTFAEAAKLSSPVRVNGISLMPVLKNLSKPVNRAIYAEYFEKGVTPSFDDFDKTHRNRRRNQMQMIRNGDTLGVRYDIKNATDDFEIYAISIDSQQTKNLALNGSLAHLQQQFKAKVLQMRMADTSAQRPYDGAPIPPAEDFKNGVSVSWSIYKVNSSWIPQVSTLKALKVGVTTVKTMNNVQVNSGDLIVYNGFFEVKTDGQYQFELTVDGKAFLKVHQINVIDEDYGYKADELKKASLYLKQGFHPFTLYYRVGVRKKMLFKIRNKEGNEILSN